MIREFDLAEVCQNGFDDLLFGCGVGDELFAELIEGAVAFALDNIVCLGKIYAKRLIGDFGSAEYDLGTRGDFF